MGGPIPRGPFDQGLFLAHYNRGRELFEARRFEEAERQLEEAYLLRPRDPRVLNLLGLVYFRGEKLEKAEEVYRKLIAESPDAHTLHYNLGIICFKLGRLENAESLFLKALELTHGNPKIHFYLGSIYEKLHRYKDAIYQYRQAGASRMVQRLQGRLGRDGDAETPPASAGSPPTVRIAAPVTPALPSRPLPPDTRPVLRPEAKATQKLTPAGEASRAEGDAPPPGRPLEAVSPSLMAEGAPPVFASTARFLVDDTLPPGTRPRTPVPSLDESPGTRPRTPVPPLDESPGTRPRTPVPSLDEPPRPVARDVFRGLEKGLMEVEFSGRVFIKQGTIYSYTGNLTFVVKEKRPGVHPWLVMVIGSGRLILTDKDREITFMQVVDEPVFVEPSHLLACEESLKPTYARLGGDEHGLEVVSLEGRGMLALSVASKPLPLSVKPGQPVSVPASSVIMWTGDILPHEVDDPEVFAVVLASSATSGRLYRLEGTGRILVEQAAGQ